MTAVTVQTNQAALAAVLAEVKSHCMCATFTETGGHYLVIFPPGYRLDGVRVSLGMGKIRAARVALEKMELTWKSSCVS